VTAAVALYVTTSQARADVQPIGCRLSPQTAKHPHAQSWSAVFNGLHPRNPCNYMDYYSYTDPEGMEG